MDELSLDNTNLDAGPLDCWPVQQKGRSALPEALSTLRRAVVP